MVRRSLVDLLRSLAIILMIFFHLCYDLTLFQFLKIDFFNNPFWFFLPRFIVALFLISSAASLVFAYQHGFDKKKYFHRLWKITLCALLISLITYFAFPQNWVIFGTLHCIALTSVIAVPFLKRPKLSAVLALLTLYLALVLGYDTQYFSRFFSFRSMDFIPVFPWMGWVWAGIFLAHTRLFQWQIAIPRLNKITYFLSTHSLKIYLLHQPLFYGVIWVLYRCQTS